jgi:hypothetical protein
LEKRAIEALPVVSSVRFHAGDKTHKAGFMPTSGVAVVRSRWGPSACRANFLRCLTAYVSLDDESSRIMAPPASLQRKSCKLLKKMLLMRPQNVLMMRELPRSLCVKLSFFWGGFTLFHCSIPRARNPGNHHRLMRLS